MTSASYRVHRLIQDLNGDPALVQRFRADAQVLFAEYELDERERTLLLEGSPRALVELGVHPNLQMKFFRVKSGPPKGGPGPLDYYIRVLAEER